MNRPLDVAVGAIVLIGCVSVAVTFLAAEPERRAEAETEEEPYYLRFVEAAEQDAGWQPFSYRTLDELIGTLDGLVGAFVLPSSTMAEMDFFNRVHTQLWRYSKTLHTGVLTAEEIAELSVGIDELVRRHPDKADLVGRVRFLAEHLVLGVEAPNIVGTDFAGVEFELADYRGKVVAIVFTGNWCTPCRAQYPHQRRLLEAIDENDFALLGVNSDADLQLAKDVKDEERLDYRSWWDGHGESLIDGPIANLYNVTAWPTIYVLDENGVVRNRRVFGDDLIAVAQELVAEMKANRADR